SFMIWLPWLTLSPSLTSTCSTLPSDGAGTSMVALSDSKVMSGSSVFTTSPGFTWMSTIGTSLKSPISGTLTSMTDIWRLPSGADGIGLLRIDTVLFDGFGDFYGRHLVFIGQRLQSRHGHEVAVNFKVISKLLAIVRSSEAIRAQYAVGAGHKRPDLIGKQFDVVG